jgi:hypothetical protein
MNRNLTKSFKILSTTLKILFCLSISVACQKKKEQPEYLSLPTNAVSLTSFQGLNDTQWLTDDIGQFLTKEATISLGGLCSQGANTVVIKIDDVSVGSNPDCNVAGRVWTYSGSFAVADGSHTLVIYGKGKDGTEYTSQQITKTIVKDTSAPSITGFTAPFADPYISYATPAVTISGDVSGGLYSMAATDTSGSFTVNAAAGKFDFQTTLNSGETRTITFTAFDKAGNASGTASFTVQYPGAFNSIAAPLSMLKQPGLGQTAPITSGTTVLSNSAVNSVGNANAYISTNSAYTLETGLTPSMAN